MAARSILLELDSTHSHTLAHFMRTGMMPYLNHLCERGQQRPLLYEIPLQIAAWNSLHSGLSVLDHQRVGYDALKPGTYRGERGVIGLPAGSTYWEHLSQAGRRVLVMNNIGGKPARGLNGIHICDFAMHMSGHYRNATSSPPDVAEQLNSRFPDDLYHPNDFGNRHYAQPERLLTSVCENLRRKSLVFRELLEQEDWDHAHLCLDDLHGFSHMFWHHLCPANVGKDEPRYIDSPRFERAYAVLDEVVAEIIGLAGDRTSILVVALAGIGQRNTWSHVVDDIISRFEHGPGAPRLALYGRLGRVWEKTPHALTRRLLRPKTRLREEYMAIRRRRALAFAFPVNEESGAIRVNLRGREPGGRVDPGGEYERLCENLEVALRELRDEDSDTPLVADVVRLYERFGPEALLSTGLPDMLVVWSRERDINAVWSERLGRIEVGFGPARSGDHVVDGTLIAAGPAWSDSALPPKVSVLDFAPTLAEIHEVAGDQRWPGRSFAPRAGMAS